MQVNFSNVQRSSSRLQVSFQAGDTSQPGSGIRLQAAPPSTGATLGRRLLNVVTFGSYTKYHENPAQWRAFRNAMAADLQRADPHMDASTAEGTAQRLLQGYNPHKRLTAAKINNALADLAQLQAGKSPWAADPQRANASQAGIARALNSLKEKSRDLSAGESRLVERALALLDQNEPQFQEDSIRDLSFRFSESPVLSEKPLVEDKNQSVSDSFFEKALIKESSQAQATQPPRVAVNADAARAVLSILKPGRQIDAMALESGMAALTHYAQSGSTCFASVPTEIWHPDAAQRIDEAIGFLASVRAAGQPPLDLLALPLGLFPKTMSLQENHSVLIAVDMRKQQVLYLDAKGHSIEYAISEYHNASGLKSKLEQLGQSAFGPEWSASTGILQLTQAKQQGANDCVAFTHDFTRQLIDGKSVGDIERTMTAADRRQVRLRMAQDIDHHVLGGPRPT